jgi:imidazolonepropionase-like amidohydrolase
MVETGYPAMDAIRSAPSVNARVPGMDDGIGAIAPDLLADIVAVDEDPLHGIGALMNIRFAMKDGVVYNQGSDTDAGTEHSQGSGS